MTDDVLRSCGTCGLVQRVPPVEPGRRACCARCGTTLRSPARSRLANQRTAAVAAAALVLWPLGVTLPLMTIEKFGHEQASSVLDGVTALLGNGHLVVGLVVFVCSVVLPLGKLAALLLLSLSRLMREHHRALTYRLVEWTGRWGMLDVLLVAVLVAVLKLGDFMDVTIGPGLLAFTGCVGLSLVATALFDPHSLWEPQS